MENGVLIKPLLEKADNFLQLALDSVVIVLESLSGVVGVVELDLEEVCSLANPERVDDAEHVAYIVDKPVLGLTCAGVVQGFFFSKSVGVGLRVLWHFNLCAVPSLW